MTTILVVDDEPQIAEIATDYLRLAGFEVLTAADGVRALEAVRGRRPDLVVLDLGLPRLDGIDVARAIRRESDMPIIMLTARIDEDDRLHGLEIGADDYITKPFSPRELVARVKAVLRRTVIDVPRMTITRGDEPREHRHDLQLGRRENEKRDADPDVIRIANLGVIATARRRSCGRWAARSRR